MGNAPHSRKRSMPSSGTCTLDNHDVGCFHGVAIRSRVSMFVVIIMIYITLLLEQLTLESE